MVSGQRSEPTTPSANGSPSVHVLDARETQRLLPFRLLIDSVADTLQRRVYAPPRASFETPAGQWLVMPAADELGSICKIVRVGSAGGAAELGGAVLVLNPTGSPQAVIDGTVLTARRTAATTAYATDLLAPPGAAKLALFGAGALALPHVEAINVVRPLSEVRIVARTNSSANALAIFLRSHGWNARATTASEAVRGADIITTVTTAQTPVFSAADVGSGVHINAIGAHRAQSQEIPAAIFGRVRGVVIDSPEAAWVEAGDLIFARDDGLLEPKQIVDIRDRRSILGLRQDTTDVTVFKSVGHAVADLAATRLILGLLEGEAALA